MIIIFSGSIGRFPVGGHAWVDMQYLLGLRALGHTIFYLEECGQESWVYNWETEQLTSDLEYPTEYVRDCLEPIDFGKQWIYRAGGQSVGMNEEYFLEMCSRADLLIIRGSPIDLWRPEYELIKRRIFIDSDPGFTQISLVNNHEALVGTVERCHHLFTVGQNVGSEKCIVPTVGRKWSKMLPPISLSDWEYVEGDATHFTSVMQWRSYREVQYEGVSYGNKDKEFPKFIELPRLVIQRFRIALTGALPEKLSEYGWDVMPGWITSFTTDSYQRFIQDSRAEFGVAKHGYVAMNSGWFSDRSVCYLASGRPVLVQDTGISGCLPTGEGVLTFRDVTEARRGIENINSNYEHHRNVARQIAEQYFSSEKILNSLLDIAMN